MSRCPEVVKEHNYPMLAPELTANLPVLTMLQAPVLSIVVM